MDFVTGVRVETTSGPHDYVTVWIRGANVGTLCVGKGDGDRIALVLQGCRCVVDGFFERHGCHKVDCTAPPVAEREP